MARFALALFVLASCQPARSKQVGNTGMAMAIGGVAGIIASAAAGPHTEHADEMMLGASAISAAGILLYAAHELSGPEIIYKQETKTQRYSRWARVLTEHAAGAARSGNCVPVRKFQPRVHVYDSNIHDFVFMRDPEILRCLSPSPVIDATSPALEAPTEEPVESAPPGKEP